MNAVSILLQRSDGKILFQLRDNISTILHPNCWSTFGGGIELGETPEKAAVRELYEELELSIDIKELHPLAIIPLEERKVHIFTYALPHPLPRLVLHEGKEMQFFSLQELLTQKNINPDIRDFLINLLAKEKEQRGKEMIELMEKGVYSLGKWKFNRAELYEDRMIKSSPLQRKKP